MSVIIGAKRWLQWSTVVLFVFVVGSQAAMHWVWRPVKLVEKDGEPQIEVVKEVTIHENIVEKPSNAGCRALMPTGYEDNMRVSQWGSLHASNISVENCTFDLVVDGRKIMHVKISVPDTIFSEEKPTDKTYRAYAGVRLKGASITPGATRLNSTPALSNFTGTADVITYSGITYGTTMVGN